MRGDTHTHTHTPTVSYTFTVHTHSGKDETHTHTHTHFSCRHQRSPNWFHRKNKSRLVGSLKLLCCCSVGICGTWRCADTYTWRKIQRKIRDDVKPVSTRKNPPSFFTFPAVCKTYSDIFTMRRKSQKYNNKLTPNPIIRRENARTFTSQREDCSPEKNRCWLNGPTVQPSCFCVSLLSDLLLLSFLLLDVVICTSGPPYLLSQSREWTSRLV